ncbi:sugar transport protein 13 [Tanacetum coccineum]
MNRLSSNSIADTNNLVGVGNVNEEPNRPVNPNPKPSGATGWEDATINGVKEPGVQTFASVLHKKQVKNVVKITELRNEEVVEGAAIAPPLDAVDKNYVKNTLAKYGLKRVQLHDDFFLFQFETKEGMESVLENGPWLIRLVPLILNVWTPNTDLKKAEIKSAPVWVKLHHVPIVAYSEVGLSLITTQIGKPIMLDSYTSNMRLSSWGRSTYARALVEVSADKELMESIVIAIPKGKDKGHSLATIEIEYEWKPPRCSTCMVFDHVTDKCSKIPSEKVVNKVTSTSQNQHPKVHSEPRVSFSVLLDEDGGAWDDNVCNATLNVSDNEVDEEMIMEERGLNFSPKQNEVKQVISENNLSICAILESHVASSNLSRLCVSLFTHWDWTSNGAVCNKGIRIILGWNHNEVDVMVINFDDQSIHVRVWLKVEKKELFCSFIYAHNRYTHRRALWQGLGLHKLYVRNRPWCLMGDFNSTLFLNDTSAGGSNVDISMREFKECVENIKVMDDNNSGLHFTWNQKPKGTHGVLKKLDRVMANLEFMDGFAGAFAIFKPYCISDHAHSVLKLTTLNVTKPRPFKFFNILISNERFTEVVSGVWNQQKLDDTQELLDKDPYNVSLRENEARYVNEFNEAALMEEQFLKQKAKIQWLKEGDSNSAHFHKVVKSRITFLGQPGDTNGFNTSDLFRSRLDDQVTLYMVRDVTREEVKEALFSMGDDKALGPDRYTTAFFKKAWDVVANEVTDSLLMASS